MEEATEICKLRLFLKLVAQVDSVDKIEPLPDIDFNIRAGNTLVGFVSVDEIRKAAEIAPDGQKHIFFSSTKDEIKQIEEDAGIVELAFKRFHEMQTEHEMDAQDFKVAKEDLSERLKVLAWKLDQYLVKEYGIDLKNKKAFEAWRNSHQPFHWFVEFYGIMSRGGFDVIIGNPPYIQVPKNLSRRLLKSNYRTALERWSRDEDLYTMVAERSLSIGREQFFTFGMILPLSLTFSTKKPFKIFRQVLSKQRGTWWLSHFDRIPSSLFGNEVRIRCTISILAINRAHPSNELNTTALNRWPSEKRDILFQQIQYSKIIVNISNGIPKVGSQVQADTLKALLLKKSSLDNDLSESIPFTALASSAPNFPQPGVFIGGTAYNWFPVWREIPETFNIRGKPSLPARTAGFLFRDAKTADIIFALLASSLGYWWWAVASDGFNLKKWLIKTFPLSKQSLEPDVKNKLAKLGAELRKELKKHYVYKENKGKIGNYFLPACSEEIKQIDTVLAHNVNGLSPEFFADIRSFNTIFSRSDHSTINSDI